MSDAADHAVNPTPRSEFAWRRSSISAVKDAEGRWWNPETGQPACGAETRDGRNCPAPPMKNRERCRMHGGGTPRGIASPSYQGKWYSKDLPPRLAAMFEEVANDPDWLSSRDDINLLRTRMRELMQQLNTGDGGTIFERLRELAEDYTAARESGDMGGVCGAGDAMVRAIEQGAKYEATWNELNRVADGVSKIRDRESKRLIAAEQVITADKAAVLISAMVSAVHAEVTDAKVLDRLGRRFQEILTRGEARPVMDVASLPAPIEDAGIEEDSEESPVLEE